jgi:hypothetical protein
MRKEIIATASIMKAPPIDATNGTKTLVPFLLLHEPEVQRFGFLPKLAHTVIHNHVIYLTLSDTIHF